MDYEDTCWGEREGRKQEIRLNAFWALTLESITSLRDDLTTLEEFISSRL